MNTNWLAIEDEPKYCLQIDVYYAGFTRFRNVVEILE